MHTSTGYEPNSAAVGVGPLMNHRGTTEGTVMTPVGPVAISPPNVPSLERSSALGNYAADGSRSASSAMVPMRSGEVVPVPRGGVDSPPKAMLRTEVQQLEQYAQQTKTQVMHEAMDALQSQRT